MEFLTQSDIVLLSVNLLILVVLVYVLFRAKNTDAEDSLLDALLKDNENQAELIRQFMAENQRDLDEKLARSQTQLFETISTDREKQLESLTALRMSLQERFASSEKSLSENIQTFKVDMVERFEQLKRNSTQLISENIDKGIKDLRQDLDRSLKQQSEQINKSISSLTESTDNRLKEISGQVEKRLTEGFEKTNQTFSDVVKRLALIDDAQKKITELSTNVVSLQEILNDKRSRGAFGEVQLQSLVSNIMPESHYNMQQKLSNDKIADCVLSLPEPTGKIAIDAKFPLESYKKMMDVEVADVDRKEAARQFSRDIKKHITDISEKYIIPPETSNGAVMFIPAESVFAEIHGHYPELVEYAYKCKVWLVSPTTLMAILTTASAVIKDEQTRKQVHIIKEHLSYLGKDFGRFQERMDKLSNHIALVSKDVDSVHTSAKKITSRFDKIERVDLSQEQQATLEDKENIEKGTS